MTRVKSWWHRRQFRRLPPWRGQHFDVYSAFELKVKLERVQASLREGYSQ